MWHYQEEEDQEDLVESVGDLGRDLVTLAADTDQTGLTLDSRTSITMAAQGGTLGQEAKKLMPTNKLSGRELKKTERSGQQKSDPSE